MAFCFFEVKIDRETVERLREKKRAWPFAARLTWESAERKTRYKAALDSLKREAVRLCEAAFVARRSNELAAMDTVVVRLPSSVNWDGHSAAIDALSRQLLEFGRQRNPKNPVILIYTTNYHIVPNVIFDPAQEYQAYSSKRLVELLRSEELVGFVARTDAMFEFGKAAVFALPSGVFADYFFRVGNLQSDADFCQAMLFWALPHMAQVTSIVADTWSISTTAASLGSGLSQYRSGDTRVAWSHMFEYLPTSSESQERLKRSVAALEGNTDRLLFLNSFRSSGRLEAAVKAAANELGFSDRVDFLSIYGVQPDQDSDVSLLCDLTNFFGERGLEGMIEHGTARSTPVFNIHKRTYFPDFRKPIVKSFSVKSSALDKNFFERYAGLGIFSVCRTGGSATYTGTEGFDTKSRHHAFHVDAQRLFESDEFAKRLDSLDPKPLDSVFTNGSSASLKLAELYIEASGSKRAKVIVGSHAGFGDVAENSDVSGFLAESSGRTIAFCVPMVVSGAGLGNLQEQLRRVLGSPKNIRANVVIVIGLLRPDHPEKLSRLKSSYLRRGDPSGFAWHEPLVVESIVLPNWQEDRCPWTSERRVITRTLQAQSLNDPDRDLLLSRKEVLEKLARTGLSDSRVFFTRDRDIRLRFNPDSLWLDEDKVGDEEEVAQMLEQVGFLGSSTVYKRTSEGDLCCAVASAIQRWRVEAAKDPFHFATIDSAVLTDHNGFNEARLRAAIWRSLTLEERVAAIRSTERANDFETMCQRIFPITELDANYSSLELEAVLAFRRDLVRVMKGSRGNSDWSSLSLLALSA
jgi:hypothetical protein